MSKKQDKNRKSPTAAERADRIKAAQEREKRARARSEAQAKSKKIFTIVVCVILILALCIPTMALTVLGG